LRSGVVFRRIGYLRKHGCSREENSQSPNKNVEPSVIFHYCHAH